MTNTQKLCFFSLSIIIGFCSCEKEFVNKDPITFNFKEQKIIPQKESIILENWQLKDIELDSLPGVSLERTYSELLKDKKSEEVIVALLDDHLDIDHEDLKFQIWTNRDEIPNNGIDDDGNGYIDDINGWNFTGNDKGEQVIYMNNEVTRVLRSLDPNFRNSLSEKNKYDNQIYLRAKEEYEKQLEQAERDLRYANYVQNITLKSREVLSKYIPNRDFSLENLNKIPVDSNDTKLHGYITVLKEYIKYDITDDWMKKTKHNAEGALEKQLNPNYNERTAIIGDDPEDVTDIYYGNNQVGNYLDYFKHSTQVASVIAATRNNNLGIDGVSNNIKIMPVCVSTEGNEHDKDIAVGIKYAVDNGARIINMSLGKMFSLHSEWVFDAFKYAEKHGVLIVSSAGNSNFDLDKENDYFFMDNLDNGKEVSGNFLLVGSSTHKPNEQLKSSFSNYGSIDVDLFAPGDSIYVAYPENKYIYNSGTSLASALTSGVAALVLSYYPDLSGNDLKQILMKSGVVYDVKVNIAGREEESELVPFSEISKTGRILNAYNAILLASKWPVKGVD